MSFLTDFNIKKKNCWHIFEKKYNQGTNEPYEICSKCSYRRKFKPKNLSLIPFLFSAFQQSNSSYKLPLSKLRNYVSEHQFFTNWNEVCYDGWRLPAVGEPYESCGIWKTFGCRNTQGHEKLGYKKKVFVKQFQHSCFRPLCKKCYVNWVRREANKATKRIEEGSKKLHMQPIHVVLSVSPAHYSYSYKKLKKIADSLVKDLNIKGAAIIFHPYRYNEHKREYYWSPQFHIVGFGYIKGRIGYAFRKYGWYIVYCGPRRSVFQTFVYLLSHAGVKRPFHTVRWLGEISYSKLHIEKGPDPSLCPYCQRKLEEVYYEELFHPVVPPDQYFEGLVDADGWYPVNTVPESEKQDNYEYHPIKQVNDILKGITEAN